MSTDKMSCPFSERYHVVQLGWFSYAVLCGDGKRILFKTRNKHAALNMASELSTAFYDGKYVGETDEH